MIFRKREARKPVARSKIESIDVARGFGKALDHDDFMSVQGLIDPACVYTIGDTTLHGPQAIADSYRQNMLNGRNKFDELVWGESGVEQLATDVFLLHFTDHIKHCGQSLIHRSRQQITIGTNRRIVRIEHLADAQESARLQEFYRQVGLES